MAAVFVALFAFECLAEDPPLLQAIKDLIKKNREEASGTGTPGQIISCTLSLSPDRGEPGTTVRIRGTTVPALDNVRATIRVRRWIPYAFDHDKRFEDLHVFEGTLRGGVLETTWPCPTDTGSDSSYSMTFTIMTDQLYCHEYRDFPIEKPPVISSLSCDPSYVVNKQIWIYAHVGSGGTFTETWYLDGKPVKGPVQESHGPMFLSAGLPLTFGTVGTHKVAFVLENTFGLAEKTCTFSVVPGPAPQIALTSQTERLLIDEQGKWCVQWKTSTNSNTLTTRMYDPAVEQQQPAGSTGTYCFTYSFRAPGYRSLYFTITDEWGLKAQINALVRVAACPDDQKECRGGCIGLTDVCCQTGPPGSCSQGQQCCGDACCAAGEVCDAANSACCPANSRYIAGKGICCPTNAPEVCGDKCMPAGATCCNSYHCSGAADHVCCFDGRCCPRGTTCCPDGGCCPTGSTCVPGGCSGGTACPPDNPQRCGTMCIPAGYACCGGVSACAPGNMCCGTDHCCPTGSPCCGAGCCQGGALCCPGATACCPQLSQCCGTGCCPTGTTCCGAGCCPAGTVCQNGGCVQGASSIQSIESHHAPGIAPGSPPFIYMGGQIAPANALPLRLK